MAAVLAHSEVAVPSRYEAAAVDDSFPACSAAEHSVVADSPVAAEDDCLAARFADIRRGTAAATDDSSPDDCWTAADSRDDSSPDDCSAAADSRDDSCPDDCSEPVDSAEADSPGWADSAPADSAAAGWAVAGCSAG